LNILVAGREGQLARSLLEANSDGKVRIVAVGRPRLDLTDPRSVEALVRQIRPDVVINTAAHTAVDKAESEPTVAHAVNAAGAGYLAFACSANSVPLIHMSTYFVFDGSKDECYVENDPVSPINAYGRSKLEGEKNVANGFDRHVILRTAWVHSPWGGNFVKTMLRLATERSLINVVDDQLGSPTYAPHLAALVLAVARRIVADPAGVSWGVYHAAGSGGTSWFGFANEVFHRAGELGLARPKVSAIKAVDYPTPARRPANSRLGCAKLHRCFALELPDWRIGVRECVTRLANSQRDPRRQA
jgi:dTDP-4-dehydrorhamnose reductase